MNKSNYFLHPILFRQEKHYEKRNCKVVVEGSVMYFYIQTATSSQKIFDRLRIHTDSMKQIINKYNELKQEEQ